jgi:hypothetical protein
MIFNQSSIVVQTMALLSRIACAPGLTEQIYQRRLHAICDSELTLSVSCQGGGTANCGPAAHSDFSHLDAENGAGEECRGKRYPLTGEQPV